MDNNSLINRLTGEFLSKELEIDFKDSTKVRDNRYISYASLLIGITYVLTIISDLYKNLPPHLLEITIIVKISIFLFSFGLFYITKYKPKHINFYIIFFQLIITSYQTFSTIILPTNPLLHIVYFLTLISFYLIIPARGKFLYLFPYLMHVGFVVARLSTTVPNMSLFIGINILFLIVNTVLPYHSIQINSYKRENHFNQAKIKKLSKSKDLFFRIFAHDFKNPLTIVLANLSYLSKTSETIERDKLKSKVETTSKNVSSMLSLLSNMNDWILVQEDLLESRGKEDITIEDIKISISPFTDAIKQKNITIKNDCIGLKTSFNKSIFQASVRNLLNNAIKFSHPDGVIEIGYKQSPNTIEIFVKDYGVGMSEELTKNLLIVDSNIASAGTCGTKGSGVGLIIIKEFLQMHGATLKVASKINEGSTFSIIIKTA